MGGEESTLSRQKEKNQEKNKELTKDYEKSFNLFKENPLYLKQLLVEIPCVANRLLQLFPKAKDEYRNYVQMIGYLRKYEPTIATNQIPKENIVNTTLIDRFFMLCLDVKSYQEYTQKEMTPPQLEKLFLNYMKIYIEKPEPGFIEKLLKFIHLDDKQVIKVKDFASEVREFLPHTQKHLKDYYQFKFRDLEKRCFLLQRFNSSILSEDAVLLAMKIDLMAGREIKKLYSSEGGGLSFHSIEKRMVGYTGHWLLLVEHVEKEQGKNVTYKFGTFQSGPILDVHNFQGNVEAFMFSIEPKIRFMTTDKGDNGQQYFFINNIDEKLSKRRKGFGFGGTKNKENFKLWIDEDIDKSTVFNGNDPTYGFGPLANIATDTLSIRTMEIWGLGNQRNLDEQAEYWEQRQREIEKRRKVNKKELLDGNANLIFEKTFAHRDQVVGQIERKEEEEK